VADVGVSRPAPAAPADGLFRLFHASCSEFVCGKLL
jgi:hypothetical protein